MKWYKKLGWIVLSIFILALLCIVIYGMGRDIVGFIPSWLAYVIVGAASLTILTVLVTIFVMGIAHIRDLCKEN